MDFLLKNIGTIIVLAALVLVVVLIIRHMKKDKTAGKTSCGCGCTNCAMRGSCHSNGKK
ncbi:MAG: FeoB-associated Cys-rich membrane protein [Clostridia bacterium]|nr:FeoB-associated Cys-rich membrane protein [Clostridia bacterium]